MHNEEVHAGGNGLLKRKEAGVDGGADARDAPRVGHLEAIAGAGRILVGGPASALIAIGNEVFE